MAEGGGEDLERQLEGLRMKRFVKLTSVLIGALAMMAVAAGTASAHIEKTKQPFTISYSSSAITTEGEVTCKGFHETNSALFPGTETEGGRDREHCKAASGHKFTALTGGQTGNMFPGSPSYESDWFFLKGESGEKIASTRVLFTVKPNDKVFSLLVYVPLEGAYPPIAESLAP
jgi:hypothetical protein